MKVAKGAWAHGEALDGEGEYKWQAEPKAEESSSVKNLLTLKCMVLKQK